MSDPENGLLDAALEYARRGWPVLPLHSVNGDARCTCGRQDCPSPGKHPRTGHGVKDATTDEKEIRAWWSDWPDANIGVPTGAGTFVSLDLDRKGDGTDGAEVVKALHGWEPDGPVQRTGGGGLQALYAHPGEHVGSKTGLLDGVDVKGDGGYVVVPPSLHASGSRYEWMEGPDVELPPLPDWLGEALKQAAKHGEHPTPPPGRVFSSTPELERRAVAYLAAMPPAISGQRGHDACYAAATAVVHGFGIPPDRAFELLLEHYNPGCEPPWSEKELRHKVEDAAVKPHERPFGWLREPESDTGTVDLSVIVGSPEPEVRDPGPFPGHLLRVPGFVGEVMAYCLETAHKPQPILALGGALCLQAVLAARKVRDPRGNRTNLYVLGVAESGRGKEQIRKVNRKTLFHAGLGHLEGSEEFASDSGLLKAVELQPAVLFQLDEVGRMLKTIGDARRSHLYNIATALMKLYSCADTAFLGKAYADEKRNREINQPCPVLLGTTIPDSLYRSLSAESLEDGFLARLLILETEDNPKRRRVEERPVPPAVLETARWWGEFTPGGNLSEQNPEPRVVDYTADAWELFDALAELADAESERGHSALWARAEEKACRLALVYACSADRESPVIDGGAARWACELSAYLTRRLIFRAHEWIADGEFDAKQKKVLRVIRAAGGEISQRELGRSTRAWPVRERDEVLENMEATGQIRRDTQPTGGRPKTVYSLP